MVGRIEQLPNGVVIHQATDESADKSNIYCETPWCPPDSHCFVYSRHAPGRAPNRQEFVACTFGAWEKRVVGHGSGGQSMGRGRFYFRRTGEDGRQALVRCDLMAETAETIDLPEAVQGGFSLAVSPDERYVAFVRALSFGPQLFGVGLADLKTGDCRIIHEDPYICNPHLQFEPSTGRQLLVQHNRGCRYSADGRRELLCGPEGCTLFVLGIPDGNVTRLPVGPPHTLGCSGHETWLGDTGQVIATLDSVDDADFGKGPVVVVRPGSTHRLVCPPWELNHIGVEPSGRLFAGDTFSPDQVLIGSPWTDKVVVVCPSHSTYQRAAKRPGGPGLVHDSHPHAYVTPDRKWVVLNSDRTGTQQIYAAELPAEMVADVERAPSEPKE